jgi:hypothetical protein
MWAPSEICQKNCQSKHSPNGRTPNRGTVLLPRPLTALLILLSVSGNVLSHHFLNMPKELYTLVYLHMHI